MDEIKTFRVNLFPTSDQEQALLETMRLRRDAANEVSQWIFDNDYPIGHCTVHNALYYQLRERYPALVSNHICQIFTDVCSNYKTLQTQLKSTPAKYKDDKGRWQNCKDLKGKVIYKDLNWRYKPIQYKSLTMRFTRGDCYRFLRNGQLTLSTVIGRINVEYFVHERERHYFDAPWKLGTTTLVYRNHRWFLHIPATREISNFTDGQRYHPFLETVGIDRGTRFLATTYDGYHTRFFSGKQVAHKKDQYFRVRRSLQTTNTKSSRRRLKAIGHRENRFVTDVNHCVSKALLSQYPVGTVFVLEDLTGITTEQQNLQNSKRTNRRRRSWAFYQFEQFLSYKAAAVGSTVITVDRAYTSQRCPSCGTVSKDNRMKNSHEYSCSCGFRTNDDRIAAINIRELGLLWKRGIDKPKIKKTGTLG